MTLTEELVVIWIKSAATQVRNSNQITMPLARLHALGDAEDSLLRAIALCNKLPAHLKAKHRGPIMSRLNKVRALARRAAA